MTERELCNGKRWDMWRYVPCHHYAVRDGLCNFCDPQKKAEKLAALNAKWAADREAARQARNEAARATVREYLRWAENDVECTHESLLKRWEREPKP